MICSLALTAKSTSEPEAIIITSGLLIQSAEYKESVLPSSVENRIIVEAGSRLSWGEFAGLKGKYITMDTFGASGKPGDLFKAYHFTVEDVIKAIKEF